MTITLQNISDRLALRLKDINDVSSTQMQNWATDLNYFLYTEMFAVDPERFISTQSYTLSASPSTQALPAGFRDIGESGTGFYYVNAQGQNTQQRLPMTSFGSSQAGYYITGSNVVFTGINVATTIILRYIPTLAAISSYSGTFCVPDENAELLELGMVARYYRDEEDLQQIMAEQDFSRVLGIFLAKLKRSPHAYAPFTSINSGA